jgi:hypothetical protein
MTTTAEWVSSYADAAGISPPSPDDIDVLLHLTGVAAHASERTAAPVTCSIAAIAGLSPAHALALAESMAADVTGRDGVRSAHHAVARRPRMSIQAGRRTGRRAA